MCKYICNIWTMMNTATNARNNEPVSIIPSTGARTSGQGHRPGRELAVARAGSGAVGNVQPRLPQSMWTRQGHAGCITHVWRERADHRVGRWVMVCGTHVRVALVFCGVKAPLHCKSHAVHNPCIFLTYRFNIALPDLPAIRLHRNR